MEQFKINTSDWTKINPDNAKFILNEAQTYVKYLSDVSGRITARAFAILTIFIPVISGLIAYMINLAQKQPISGFVFSYTAAVAIVLIGIAIVLIYLIAPRLFMPVGRAPIEICNDALLGLNLDKELAYLAIVLNEIENCQVKIDFNEAQNHRRARWLKYAIISLLVLFILAISTIIVYFLSV